MKTEPIFHIWFMLKEQGKDWARSLCLTNHSSRGSRLVSGDLDRLYRNYVDRVDEGQWDAGCYLHPAAHRLYPAGSRAFRISGPDRRCRL